MTRSELSRTRLWVPVVRQDWSQSQRVKPEGAQRDSCWGDAVDAGGCSSPLSPRRGLDSINQAVRSGQKSEPILSSKHKLSLFLLSPLQPPGIIRFLQRQFFIRAPRTQLPAYQVENFNRFFKVTEPQAFLPRELGAVSTW